MLELLWAVLHCAVLNHAVLHDGLDWYNLLPRLLLYHRDTL